MAGLGSHAVSSTLQDLVAFDTANTVPFATMEVSGTTGILTFNENATSLNLVLGKTTATGAAGAASSITIDATADLQTAVDAINGAAVVLAQLSMGTLLQSLLPQAVDLLLVQ